MWVKSHLSYYYRLLLWITGIDIRLIDSVPHSVTGGYCCHLVNSSCYIRYAQEIQSECLEGSARLVSNTDDLCKSKYNFHWRVVPSETQRRLVWQKVTHIYHWKFKATDLKMKAIQSSDTVISVSHHTASTSDRKSIPSNVHKPGATAINQRSMVKSGRKLPRWIVIY